MPSRTAISRRGFLIALAAAGTATAGGDADRDAWPMVDCDPGRTSATAAAGPTPPLTVAWEFGPPITASPPVVAGGTVYVGTRASGVYAVDADDGTARDGWPFDRPAGATVTPAVTDDAAYAVDTEYGHVYAIDRRTGTEREAWSFAARLPNPTYRSVPVVEGDTVYLASGTNVYALDARTGAVRDGWPYAVPSSTVSSPAVADGTVYVTTADGAYAIDAVDGTTREGWPVALPATLATPPTATPEAVYVLGSRESPRGDALYALDPADGTVREGWPFEGPAQSSFSHVAVGSDAVYLTGSDLYAVDPDTGAVRDGWAFDAEFPDAPSSGIGLAPAVADDAVYVAVGRGYLYRSDAATGDVADDWPFRITDHWTFRPVVADGTVYTCGVQGGPLAVTPSR